MKSAFFKVGHLPTLIACFLYFDASFAIWVLLGPLAVLIAPDLHLNPGEKGLMVVATPVLAGALLRIVNGILVSQWNARRTGLVMQLVVIAGLLAALEARAAYIPAGSCARRGARCRRCLLRYRLADGVLLVST